MTPYPGGKAGGARSKGLGAWCSWLPRCGPPAATPPRLVAAGAGSLSQPGPSTPQGVGLGLRQALGCQYLAERSEAATRLARAKLTWETIAADFAQGAGAVLDRQPGRT